MKLNIIVVFTQPQYVVVVVVFFKKIRKITK